MLTMPAYEPKQQINHQPYKKNKKEEKQKYHMVLGISNYSSIYVTNM